jgi:hypothetical protein
LSYGGHKNNFEGNPTEKEKKITKILLTYLTTFGKKNMFR